MGFTVKNIAKGARGIRTADGLVMLEAGETRSGLDVVDTAEGTGWFEITPEADQAEADRRRAEAETAKAAKAKAAAEAAAKQAEADRLTRASGTIAREKEGAPGWWQVYDAKGNEVGKAIRRDDAEKFNALDAAAKIAHLEALSEPD